MNLRNTIAQVAEAKEAMYKHASSASHSGDKKMQSWCYAQADLLQATLDNLVAKQDEIEAAFAKSLGVDPSVDLDNFDIA